MEIEILDFLADERNHRKGFLDCKIIYSPEKQETFRNIGYFEKESKKWLAFPKTKRGEKWLPLYDRNPPMQNLLNDILKAFLEYLEKSYYPNLY